MEIQTVEQMIKLGATKEEAERAGDLFHFLSPGLKIKENGRVETKEGDKTPLGLYRMVKRILRGDAQ